MNICSKIKEMDRLFLPMGLTLLLILAVYYL